MLFGACSKEQAPPPATHKPDGGTPARPAEVTVLITGDEQGQLLPIPAGPHARGGAAEVLGDLTRSESHCDGALGAEGAPACPEGETLLLSTGDHGPGTRLNAKFEGVPMAQVMKQMGYAATAVGRHDLDFGKEAFGKAKVASGMQYVASNLQPRDANAKELQFPEVVTFKRRGVIIAVIGLTHVHAMDALPAGHLGAFQIEPYENALIHAVPQAWGTGAQAVILLADACPSELQAVLEKHSDWRLSLAAGGHCPVHDDAKAGATPIAYVGARFEQYVSARLIFEGSKHKLKPVEVKHVAVQAGGDSPSPSASLAIALDAWTKKLEPDDDVPVTTVKTALAAGSPQLASWVLEAWRHVTHADIALEARGFTHAGLRAGPVTRGEVAAVLPREDALVVVKIKGADLLPDLANPRAAFSGATKAGKKFKDAKGKALDPKRSYTVVTTMPLYEGTEGFHLREHDPRPLETSLTDQSALSAANPSPSPAPRTRR
jgi:2',3'-cyclic-nucleotide 2'-phosphodiesterase (5'-nucleotidase family)